MNTRFPGLPSAGDIVYVRPVEVASLPQEVQEEVGDARVIYAVHRVDGAQLALFADRKMAFDLARQFDLAPQSVH